MRHLKDGVLRAYLDGALPVQGRERLQAHLAHCVRCQERLAHLAGRGARVQTLMQPLVAPHVGDAPARVVSPQFARIKMAAYARRKEEVSTPMSDFKGLFSRRHSPAWVAVVVMVVLGISLAFAPVRAFAGNLLSLFRVQKIEVVEFSPSALFDGQGVEAAMQALERVMDEQVTVEVQGESQEVDEAALRSLSSMRVRLPEDMEGEARYSLQPGGDISVEVDLPRIRALLVELGYHDVDLPETLDGANIDVQLAPMVVAAYGACGPNTGDEELPKIGATGGCTVLKQMRSPVVYAPDELDVAQLGQVYLQLLGMSAAEAARFSARVDWTATLVVPLPRTEAWYEDVTVDGVSGVVIRPTKNRLPLEEYLLMWVKDDIVYILMSTGDLADAVQLANSLR